MIFRVTKIIIALIFIIAGIATIGGSDRFVDEFTRWNYPLTMLTVFGSLEIICGVFLLISRVERAGSAGLLLVTLWGLLHHIFYKDAFPIMIPGIVLSLALAFVLYFQIEEYRKHNV